LAFDGGMLLVANSTGNNVLVFRPDGTLFTTIKDPLFNGPWGITVKRAELENQDKMVSFFTANKFDAKILRVDVMPSGSDVPKFHVTQIGQFTQNGTQTKIDLNWLPILKIGKDVLQDVLLAIDPANNRIAAFVHSSISPQGMSNGMTIFQGKPLNMPGGLAINPFNGDLLVVNLMDNNLVELNPTSGQSVGVKQIDPAMVDNQGNGSALFGVVGVKDQQGNLRVFFTDDNSNTLNMLSASSNNSKPDNSKPDSFNLLDLLGML
jgi:DNA-binding beta-propeller fold protein YncE